MKINGANLLAKPTFENGALNSLQLLSLFLGIDLRDRTLLIFNFKTRLGELICSCYVNMHKEY